MKKKNSSSVFIWIFLYVLLIFTPLIVMLLGPKPGGRPELLDLSVSLGFVGLAIMALQFVNSARLKFLNKPFGTDLSIIFTGRSALPHFSWCSAIQSCSSFWTHAISSCSTWLQHPGLQGSALQLCCC